MPRSLLERAVVALLALAALAPVSRAQDTISFKSAKLDEQRAIYVATPAGYRAGTTRYPVLVLLDANDAPQFAAALANVSFLTNRGALPGLIVVGIPNGKDRTHDLTPPATGAGMKLFATAGGAARFADFITDEVLPMVRAKYRALPTTVLAGHSFGGLFALHIAATRPGAFTGIVAMSPSLWWNDSTVVPAYAEGIARASAPARIFATSGGLEPPIDVTTKRFASRLDSVKPSTLAFAYRYYPDDTHGLTPAPSLMDGLRFVFEPVTLTRSPMMTLLPGTDSATVVTAVVATEERYARGARSLGLPDRLPESVMNSFGYTVLRGLGMPGVAAWIFARNASNYPDSPNVHDSWGDALLAKGDTAAARSQFRQARDVAVRVGQPVAEETRQKLEALDHATQAGQPKRP